MTAPPPPAPPIVRALCRGLHSPASGFGLSAAHARGEKNLPDPGHPPVSDGGPTESSLNAKSWTGDGHPTFGDTPR
jgi:hypothetical protein